MTIFGPSETIIDYMSLGLGQSINFLSPSGLEVCVDSDADVDCSDFKRIDSNVDADVDPESADSVDLSDFYFNSDFDLVGTTEVLGVDIIEVLVIDIAEELVANMV